jgi:hypothetical protein
VREARSEAERELAGTGGDVVSRLEARMRELVDTENRLTALLDKIAAAAERIDAAEERALASERRISGLERTVER